MHVKFIFDETACLGSAGLRIRRHIKKRAIETMTRLLSHGAGNGNRTHL
ncbi:hypothetical protein [uncultured Selenomonas sp.]|nr:hypothetical protein [uncultured Selenomonas sp.]